MQVASFGSQGTAVAWHLRILEPEGFFLLSLEIARSSLALTFRCNKGDIVGMLTD